MKTEIKYYSEGQNVYEQYTKYGRVYTDLICVATSINNAKGIIDSFNACVGLLKNTTTQDTGLSEIRFLAHNAIN